MCEVNAGETGEMHFGDLLFVCQWMCGSCPLSDDGGFTFEVQKLFCEYFMRGFEVEAFSWCIVVYCGDVLDIAM